MSALSDFRLRRRIASLVRDWRRGSPLPLIILPSTPASLQFASQLSRDMPVAVIGSPRLLADWAPSFCVQARSPLDVWRDVKMHKQLPYAVISYPDQLIGVDPSFYRVAIGDSNCAFSIVEMMLLMKFRAPAYLGKVRFCGRGEKAASTLTLHGFAGEVPAGLPKGEFDEWMLRLMEPVIECSRNPHDGWLARDVFALKVDGNFEKMLKIRLLEIEALLRMGDDLPEPVPLYRELQVELQSLRRKPQLLTG
jgi:hypothetical protein